MKNNTISLQPNDNESLLTKSCQKTLTLSSSRACRGTKGDSMLRQACPEYAVLLRRAQDERRYRRAQHERNQSWSFPTCSRIELAERLSIASSSPVSCSSITSLTPV